MEKIHGAKSKGNQTQASLGGVTQDTLNYPSMSCDNTCEVLQTREVC